MSCRSNYCCINYYYAIKSYHTNSLFYNSFRRHISPFSLILFDKHTYQIIYTFQFIFFAFSLKSTQYSSIYYRTCSNMANIITETCV